MQSVSPRRITSQLQLLHGMFLLNIWNRHLRDFKGWCYLPWQSIIKSNPMQFGTRGIYHLVHCSVMLYRRKILSAQDQSEQMLRCFLYLLWVATSKQYSWLHWRLSMGTRADCIISASHQTLGTYPNIMFTFSFPHIYAIVIWIVFVNLAFCLSEAALSSWRFDFFKTASSAVFR